MKIQWSAFYSLFLLALAGCGSEQFGTVPQSTTSKPDSLRNYEQLSCTSHTLIKPKVDILYVVDNSGSAFYFSDDIKTAITNTVNTISQQFDYRMVGTTLIPDSTPYNDYQVLTNSTDPLPDSGKKIISSSELNFFQSPGSSQVSEKGLGRTVDFINNTGNLFRRDAYLLVVLVSNGRDTEVELDPQGDGNTVSNPNGLFGTRVNQFNAIKTRLNLTQLRFFAVTAATNKCKGDDWRRSTESYIAMANALPNSTSFDLCTKSVSNIFAEVNSSIQQQVIPHQYRYWPITFAENTETVSLAEIQVKKFSPNGSSTVLARNTHWTLEPDTGSTKTVNTRELPSPGEPVTGRHFIKFTNLITYPDCVQVTSVSRTEYFGYVVLPKEPKPESISLRVNGSIVAQSSSMGWTYIGYKMSQNTKVPHQGETDQPAVIKSGYMLKLNGMVYKSGDSVEVNYIPAGL
jgi:hypothetical protein